MILQRTILERTETPELFYRRGKSDGSSLRLGQGESASFDTYFGCFSYPIYRKYTAVKNVIVSVTVSGDCYIELCLFDGERETLIGKEAVLDGTAELEADITALPDIGIIYPRVRAKSEAVIRKVEYHADVEQRDIRTAIAFCTYRREEALKGNLKRLLSYKPLQTEKIFVIDNGGTLEGIESERVSLIKNRNAGGSAGFTRGIIEARNAGFSHVILMDDDVEVFPESLERTVSLLSLLRPEYKGAHVSAAMLRSTRPTVQHELGARLDGGRIVSLKNGLDMKSRRSLIENLIDEGAQYGAWWCFALPLSDADLHGLPMPFFIKFDDVEYGLRTVSEKAPVIAMNGVAVRHEDFDLKYSPHLEYYNIRNNLITGTIHGRVGLREAISRLIKSVGKSILLYRYDTAELMMRAYGDFLSGAGCLSLIDPEALNREVMKSVPRAEKIDKRMLRLELKHRKPSSLSKKAILFLTLGGHLLPSFLLEDTPSVTQYHVTSVGDVFLRRTSIQYKNGSEGYIYKRSFSRFLKCSARAFLLFFKAVFTFGRAKRSYLEAMPHLTSEDFWSDYLKLK